MDAIVVDGLVKQYARRRFRRNRPALDGVSMRVPKGSAYGLIGPNGAGKTTLLKALLGVVHPDAGKLAVLGGAPDDVEVRRRIGYLPERQALPEAFTARAFLRSVARLKGLPSIDDEAERALSRVGLSAEHGRIRTFSKGMQQRVGLGAALLGAPELLVLDEPTDGIDPKGRADVRAILKEELARGASVLLNSHLLSETEKLCDQLGILVGGRLLRSGSVAEVCGAKDLESVLLELMERQGA